MKVYEAAKLLKITNKAFLEEYGLKSHLSKLPEALEAELFGDEKKTEEAGEPVTETINSAEADVVTETVNTAETEVCPYTPRQISKSIKLAGNKSPCWKWRHLG
jgi:hypothetical protein